ncbi:MAG TPA: acyl-CoA thioesterase [Blastocatellia bacterium]|nr:acyl-CoA thioesterase [Blastocatellia bacterium]
MSDSKPVSEEFNACADPAIRVVLMPKDTNAHGTIFGGVILSYIDLAAAIEVRKHTNKKFVTVAMHEVVFVAPVFVGDLVSFYTELVRVGRTSITTKVIVEADRVSQPGTRVRVTEAEVVYVAVDDNRKPVPIRDSPPDDE